MLPEPVPVPVAVAKDVLRPASGSSGMKAFLKTFGSGISVGGLDFFFPWLVVVLVLAGLGVV